MGGVTEQEETALYRLRKGCDLTQEQLAIMTNRTQGHISMWEASSVPMPKSAKDACYKVFRKMYPNTFLVEFMEEYSKSGESMSLQTPWTEIEKIVGISLG